MGAGGLNSGPPAAWWGLYWVTYCFLWSTNTGPALCPGRSPRHTRSPLNEEDATDPTLCVDAACSGTLWASCEVCKNPTSIPLPWENVNMYIICIYMYVCLYTHTCTHMCPKNKASWKPTLHSDLLRKLILGDRLAWEAFLILNSRMRQANPPDSYSLACGDEVMQSESCCLHRPSSLL